MVQTEYKITGEDSRIIRDESPPAAENEPTPENEAVDHSTPIQGVATSFDTLTDSDSAAWAEDKRLCEAHRVTEPCAICMTTDPEPNIHKQRALAVLEKRRRVGG